VKRSNKLRTTVVAAVLLGILGGCATQKSAGRNSYIPSLDDRMTTRCGSLDVCMKLVPEGGCHGDRACLESVDECTERYRQCTDPFLGVHVHNVTLSNGEKYRIRTHSMTYGPTETEVKRVR
jgi:hypothetical protein